MTIENAIQILEDIIDTAHYSDYPDDHGAIALAIEALKATKEYRRTCSSDLLFHLPGETKE